MLTIHTRGNDICDQQDVVWITILTTVYCGWCVCQTCLDLLLHASVPVLGSHHLRWVPLQSSTRGCCTSFLHDSSKSRKAATRILLRSQERAMRGKNKKGWLQWLAAIPILAILTLIPSFPFLVSLSAFHSFPLPCSPQEKVLSQG